MTPEFRIEVEALAGALDLIDYFGILKIPQSAGLPEIKAAYYRESRAYHPDRFAAVPDPELRACVGKIYRRINEAYTVLRDEQRRRKYVADVNGPDRAARLRFTEADETQLKDEQKRKLEEQFGQTPNGRKLYATALQEMDAGRWEAAERALKTALMYEPGNARFQEQLAVAEKNKPRSDPFRIK